MDTESPPLVSLAVPLYASGAFFEYIVENLSTQDYPNLEIIVSDRHGLDDTVSRLRERFAADRRFVFVEGRERLDWVAHYNDLLRRANGAYFLWMPHDDSYPADYVSELVARLEERPDVILAFGSRRPVDLGGNPVPAREVPPPPFSESEPWTARVAVRLLTTWRLGLPFRGVFRRDAVLRTGLYIRPTYGNASSDVYWVFAVALAGRLSFVPDCCCVKRYYSTSTQMRHPGTLRSAATVFPVLRSYLREHQMSWGEVVLLNSLVFGWSLYQVLLQLTPVPDAVPRVARRVLRSLLA